MAEGTNDFLKRFFLQMELLDVSLMAVSERLDSEDGLLCFLHAHLHFTRPPDLFY